MSDDCPICGDPYLEAKPWEGTTAYLHETGWCAPEDPREADRRDNTLDDLYTDLIALLGKWDWASEYIDQDMHLEGDYAGGLQRAADDVREVLEGYDITGPKPCGDQHALPCGVDERCPVPVEFHDVDKTDLEVVTDWEDSHE